MVTKKIWIYVEHRDGEIGESFYELTYLAKRFAIEDDSELSAVLLGHEIHEIAEAVSCYGLDNIYRFDHPGLRFYATDLYQGALCDLINKENPSLFLFGATWQGMDLTPRLSAALHAPLFSQCVNIFLNADKDFVFTRRGIYNHFEKQFIPMAAGPSIATVIPTVFPKEIPDKRNIKSANQISLEIKHDTSNVQILSSEKDMNPDLEAADIVISGGRGIGSPEILSQLENLAGILGAAVGVSRPVVDAGWKPIDSLIGITGKTIFPKLYIALGISGAIQHLMGMHESRYVVAINKDPDAPIMKIADLALVGDVKALLPILIQNIQAAVAEGENNRLKKNYENSSRVKTGT